NTDQLTDAIEYLNDIDTQGLPDEATRPPFDEVTYDILEGNKIRWAGDDEDTYPLQLEKQLRKARDGVYERLIVPHLYTLSNSLRDVRDTIETLHAAGVTVHITDRRVELNPRDGEKRALLTDASEFERMDNARQLDPRTAGDPHKGGRPPLGYVVENGYRRPGPEYDEVEAALHDVVNEKLSIHRAAARLDVSRTTIRNAVEQRPTLYGLDEDAALPSR
ncbi:resolvase, partial [Haloferax sp. BAB-2207]